MAADIYENARAHLCVNSWCLARESMAMWEIYGSCGRGVAVKSSVGQYRDAARFPIPATQFALRKVTYHFDDIESSPEVLQDFSGSILFGPDLWERSLAVAFHKRSCYIHEEEWRAALYQERVDISGVVVPFDLDRLINEVYVGPRSAEFFGEAVGSIMEKFLPRKPLKWSALLNPPQKPLQPKRRIYGEA